MLSLGDPQTAGGSFSSGDYTILLSSLKARKIGWREPILKDTIARREGYI